MESVQRQRDSRLAGPRARAEVEIGLIARAHELESATFHDFLGEAVDHIQLYPVLVIDIHAPAVDQSVRKPRSGHYRRRADTKDQPSDERNEMSDLRG